MYCSMCGRPTSKDAQFCAGCGQRVTPAIASGDPQLASPVPRAQHIPTPRSSDSVTYDQVESSIHSRPEPPHQYSAPPSVHVTQQVQVASPIVIYRPKSVGLALALTFFFGPLGLFYSSVVGGIVMLIASVILAATTYGISLLVTWPVCMIWGAIAASNYNSAMALTAGGPTQINKY
jgi:hypothetical protein